VSARVKKSTHLFALLVFSELGQLPVTPAAMLVSQTLGVGEALGTELDPSPVLSISLLRKGNMPV